MWLERIASSLDKIVRPVSSWIHSVGLVALLAMMFLTFVDVTLRYLFNSPIEGSFDVTELLMSVVVALGLAYCAVVRGHVTVDLLIGRLGQKAQVIINTITSFLSFVFLFLLAWQGFLYIKVILVKGLTSYVLLIPVYPFVAIIAISFSVFAVVIIRDFFDFLSRAVKK